jgi:rare lipoprotein A
LKFFKNHIIKTLNLKFIALSVIFCLGFLILTCYDVNAQESQDQNVVTYFGTASYYANKFNGLKTASGEIFDQSKLTGASNKVPLGTWVKVTNIKNGKSVIVKINDRMHYKMKRVVDLSYSGAKKIGFIKSGITKVKMEVISEIDDFLP